MRTKFGPRPLAEVFKIRQFDSETGERLPDFIVQFPRDPAPFLFLSMNQLGGKASKFLFRAFCPASLLIRLLLEQMITVTRRYSDDQAQQRCDQNHPPRVLNEI